MTISVTRHWRGRCRRHARRPRWPVAVMRTARPRQWPKNLLVFAAPLAGATLGLRDGWPTPSWPRPPSASPRSRCTSSTTWPTPSATAAIRVSGTGRSRPATCRSHTRLVLGVACALAGLAGGAAISEPLLTAAVAAYLALSFLYSWVLKHIPVIEVLFVASGFLLRVLGGAAATHVPPSGWFLLVCSLGRAQRRDRQAVHRADQPRPRGHPAPAGSCAITGRAALRLGQFVVAGDDRGLPGLGGRGAAARQDLAPAVRPPAGRWP